LNNEENKSDSENTEQNAAQGEENQEEEEAEEELIENTEAPKHISEGSLGLKDKLKRPSEDRLHVTQAKDFMRALKTPIKDGKSRLTLACMICTDRGCKKKAFNAKNASNHLKTEQKKLVKCNSQYKVKRIEEFKDVVLDFNTEQDKTQLTMNNRAKRTPKEKESPVDAFHQAAVGFVLECGGSLSSLQKPSFQNVIEKARALPSLVDSTVGYVETRNIIETTLIFEAKKPERTRVAGHVCRSGCFKVF